MSKTVLMLIVFHYCNAVHSSPSSWAIANPLTSDTRNVVHLPLSSKNSKLKRSSSSSTCHHCFKSRTIQRGRQLLVEPCGRDDCVPLVKGTSSTARNQPTKHYDFSQCGMIDNSYAIRNKALQLKISTDVNNTLRSAEYPWLVRMEIGSDISSETLTLCGATLIHPQWIVTAAHCMFDSETNRLYSISDISLYVGHYNRSNSNRNESVKKPSLYLIHPRYRTFPSPPTAIYDLVMIKLAQPVPLSRSVGVACLPDRADTLTDGTLAYTAGWGYASVDTTFMNEPRKARIKIASKSCRQLRINRDLHICGTNDRGSNICNGDSGTGLMVRAGVRSSSGQIDWKWHVFGVASFGPLGCSQSTNHDNAFSSILHDLDWIHEVMKKY